MLEYKLGLIERIFWWYFLLVESVLNNGLTYLNICMDKSKEIVISNATKEKVEAAKSFIEQRYSKLIVQEQQKKEYWDQLNRKMQMLCIPFK